MKSADGTRLAARRTGKGTPVVLVHGSAGGLDSWDPIVPLLEDRFELWVYARRGYPPSDGCPHPKTYADEVADLRAVIDAAGGSAHVVAASYGATVALHAAHTESATRTDDPPRPDNSDRLNNPDCPDDSGRLNNTGSSHDSARQESSAHPGAAAVAGTSERVAQNIRSLALFEPPLFAAGPEVAAVLEPFRKLVDAGDFVAAARLFAGEVARVPAPFVAGLDQADPGETAGCLHDLESMSADTPATGRWASVDVPVLLMQGSETWAPMPATVDALAAALPNVTRAVLTGQSHFATHTAPTVYAGHLLTFLGSL